MTLTDLDQITVGTTLASSAVTTDGKAQTFGMVVDFGLHEEDGSAYVEVLEEVPHREVRVCAYFRGAKVPRSIGVARLRRIDLADVDPVSVEEPRISRMQGWAKKALAGEVVLPGEHFALAVIAAQLYEAAEQLQAADTERRKAVL